MAPIPGKKFTPTTSEPVIETIQATAIIVIHPGSMFLRIGRPSDPYPTTIPHVIARRCNPNIKPRIENYLVQKIPVDKENLTIMEETLNLTQRLLASCLTSEGTIRYVGSTETIREYNEKTKPIIETNIKKVQPVLANQNVLIGEQALALTSEDHFNINWPIRRGRLNLHTETSGSLTSVLSDLETIWSMVISKNLEINLKDLSSYRAVLVIPDVYDRAHVREMVNLLLNKLNFAGCFVHLESVCATFGAGLSYACVVDVGDQKTSISCVEDGISHCNTRLFMEYGGSDLTHLFHWLLDRNSFPYRNCDLNNRNDAILINEMKEKFCHVNLDICGLHNRNFTIKQPNQSNISYSLMTGDECLIAPLALFTPEILALTGMKKTTVLKSNSGDSEDPYDENYLIQTQRRGIKEPSETPDFINQMFTDENPTGMDDDLDVMSECPSNINTASETGEIQCNQLYGIDQAVLQSIERCDSEELKRKMYSCLLVVGGGMNFLGIHTWLHNRLAVQTPLNYRGEDLDIIVRPKDMDPRVTVWKGAAVMSCLDTAQELWILQKEWQRYGVRMLRERAPFIW